MSYNPLEDKKDELLKCTGCNTVKAYTKSEKEALFRKEVENNISFWCDICGTNKVHVKVIL